MFDHYVVDYFRYALEAVMALFLLYVLFRKPKSSTAGPPLTTEEEDELIAEWEPEPLAKELTELQTLDLNSVEVIEKSQGVKVVVGGEELYNFASLNPHGLLGSKELEQKSAAAIRHYGVGSCGPRGFYGTIDVHLKLEQALTSFLGTDSSILFSSGFAAVASTIPTFAKKGDIIFCDKGVNHALQVGIDLSRSDVVYFDHNDVDQLEALLKKHSKKYARKRRFVVIEGLYFNYGDLPPLPQIMKLKEQFCFYLIIDESYSFGVLGKTGRGITEYHNVNVNDVDIITGNLGNALCAVGGFCSGPQYIVNHSRLNASGYVFSASLPPYLSVAANTALDIIDEQPLLLRKALEIVEVAHAILKKSQTLRVTSSLQSPIIHVGLANPIGTRCEQEQSLQKIVEKMKGEGLLLTRAKFIEKEKFLPPASIRMCIPASLSEKVVQSHLQKLVEVADATLPY